MAEKSGLSPEEGERAQGIDLTSGLDGGASVNVPEVLPSLYKEIWYDSVEDELLLHKEDYHMSPSVYKSGTGQKTGTGQNLDEKDADRWSILMGKLSNIEQNTSSLSKDLSELTARVGDNTEKISATNISAVKNEQKITELDRRFNSVWAEIDKNMQHRFAAMEAAMREENETLRATMKEENEALRAAIREENETFWVQVTEEAENKVKDITRDL